jgi:hypothetical protein
MFNFSKKTEPKKTTFSDRLIYCIIRLALRRVMAYDVYNGLCYWERELEGATRQHLPLNTSNLAADDSSLFIVTGNRRCLRLDARTGATLKSYELAKTGRAEPYWAWVARDGKARKCWRVSTS